MANLSESKILSDSPYHDYWSECDDITKNSENCIEIHDTNTSNNDLDGELEVEWLIDAGFDFLVSEIQDGKEFSSDGDHGELMSTLTPKQRATVKKRFDTVKGTLHRRPNQHHLPDVRDLFPKTQKIEEKEEKFQSKGNFQCYVSLDNRTEITIDSPEKVDESDLILKDSKKETSSTTWYHVDHKDSSLASIGCHSIVDPGENGGIIDASPHPNIASQFDSSHVDENVKNLRLSSSPTSSPRNSVEDLSPKRHGLTDILVGSHYKHGYNLHEGDHTNELPTSSVDNIEQVSYVAKGSFRQKFTYNGEFHPSIDLTTDNITKDTSQETDSSFLKVSAEGIDCLPELVPKEDDRGITSIYDLSHNDVVRVKQLALIELTALFDVLNLNYTRRKQVKKKSKGNVFGSTVTAIIAHERRCQPSCTVPRIVGTLISHLERNGLEEKGILRIPGSCAKVEILRAKIEAHYLTSPDTVDRIVRQSSVKDSAALLKHFIRDLTTPLLTNNYIDAFLQVQRISDLIYQVKALNLLILILPESNRDTLFAVMDFLNKVIQNEEINKMSLQNVAMIMAANLFLPPGNGKKYGSNIDERDLQQMSLEDEMRWARVTCQVTKLLIRYYGISWTVPSFLLKQIRLQNEAIRNKKMNYRDYKNRKKKPMKAKNESDLNKTEVPVITMIKVSTPIPKVGAFCPLNNDTLTAGDVVLKVIDEIQANSHHNNSCSNKSRPRSVSEVMRGNSPPCLLVTAEKSTFLATHYLYEVGGNIGERKLDHYVRVSSVLRENPLAEWVVKCRH